MLSPPVPTIEPEKLSAALLMESIFEPKLTVPLPARLLMEAVFELMDAISKIPSLITLLELAIEPAPDRANLAPELIIVLPV